MSEIPTDAISSVALAASDLFALIKSAIPSDELQRERFKERRPLFYAHIRKRLYNLCRRELKHRWHQDIDATVDYYMGALATDEIAYAKKMLHSELMR